MNNTVSARPRSWLRRLVRVLLWGFVAMAALLLGWGWFAFHDRHPGYQIRINRSDEDARREPRPLRAGFGRLTINPDLSDPKRPVFVAGFSQNRRATAVHDDLCAIACVLDDGWSRVGIVALDAIGFFHDDVIRVRSRLDPELKLDYVVICSTHNHSTPDLMGLWGPNFLRSGVDPAYLEQVRNACVLALNQAVSNLQPAQVTFHQVPVPTQNLVADTRKPEVFDSTLRVMRVLKTGTGETLGSLVNWGDHPETPWSRNTELTSDFCGYLREALANGIQVDGRQVLPGVGGIHLYVNGAVGGLMSTIPRVTVQDPFLNKEFQEPSHEKARALGRQLAQRVLAEFAATNAAPLSSLPIGIHAQTIDVPLANRLYLLAGYLGILDRGYVRWRTLRTEVALLTLGPASVACVPGELYPEIANGGIEQPSGADFAIPPLEVPPLRELMPGQFKFLFGLANDEVGYLVPKSQWDELPPYAYGAQHAPYGEVNSLGPEAAPTIHHAIQELCRRAQSR